jgi:hypothetical protein
MTWRASSSIGKGQGMEIVVRVSVISAPYVQYSAAVKSTRRLFEAFDQYQSNTLRSTYHEACLQMKLVGVHSFMKGYV